MDKPTEQNNQHTQLKRRGLPFAAVEHLVIDDERLSDEALLIYVHLCRYANWNTGVAFPSIERLRKRRKKRKQTIIQAIKELESYGYLKVTRASGKASVYEVGPEVTVKGAEGTGSASGTAPVPHGEPVAVPHGEPEQEIKRESITRRPDKPASSSPKASSKRQCQDPVIQAYVEEHESEYGFQPTIPFAKVGALLKNLRKRFTDDQLVKIVQTAAWQSRAWFRRDGSFDLTTILSATAINQILRDNPSILHAKRPVLICPACGAEHRGSAGCCTNCLLSLSQFNDPVEVKRYRDWAVEYGRIKAPAKEEAT